MAAVKELTKQLAAHALREQATAARQRRDIIMDCAALAKVHTPAAIRTLARALNDPQHCVAAANALLDRAWGRPAQHVTTENDVNHIHLHLLAARAIAAELPVIDAKPVDTEQKSNSRLHLFDVPDE